MPTRTAIGVGLPVLEGLRIVDLTQGIAGAMATMLLADAGADVVRIDQRDDPFAELSGSCVAPGQAPCRPRPRQR